MKIELMRKTPRLLLWEKFAYLHTGYSFIDDTSHIRNIYRINQLPEDKGNTVLNELSLNQCQCNETITKYWNCYQKPTTHLLLDFWKLLTRVLYSHEKFLCCDKYSTARGERLNYSMKFSFCFVNIPPIN